MSKDRKIPQAIPPTKNFPITIERARAGDKDLANASECGIKSNKPKKTPEAATTIRAFFVCRFGPSVRWQTSKGITMRNGAKIRIDTIDEGFIMYAEFSQTKARSTEAFSYPEPAASWLAQKTWFSGSLHEAWPSTGCRRGNSHRRISRARRQRPSAGAWTTCADRRPSSRGRFSP